MPDVFGMARHRRRWSFWDSWLYTALVVGLLVFSAMVLSATLYALARTGLLALAWHHLTRR